jgi:hypothetical protein
MTDDSPKSKTDDSWGDTYMLSTNEEAEFMSYLDKIPPEERAVLLKNLRSQGVRTRFAPEFAAAVSKEDEDGDEDDVKPPAMVSAPALTAVKPPAMVSAPVLAATKKVPARQLSTGLQISLVPRSDRDFDTINVILRKNDRGTDAIARKKTRDKVVKAMEPKLSANNISRIITSIDASSFDVAADALSWQSHLQTIRKFCVQYDMTSLLQVPTGVDLSNPVDVASATKFKHAIDDWSNLEDDDYHKWQVFIRRYGSPVELESDNWLDDTLQLSMEKTLRAEVESDISHIPSSERGSLTTLRCIIKRMVIKNQESRDALENYIKSFDITKFPGENVPIACLRLKAVAKALGNDDLPKNIIRKVLEGFSKSSTKTFNDVCASQIALRRGSLIQDVVKSTSLYTQLVGLLTDLENAYLELVGGQLWEGVAHPGVDQHNSSFNAKIVGKTPNSKNLRDGLPWEEWVKKYAKCNHCGEVGHIRPNCSKYLAAIESGEIKRPDKKPVRDLGRRPKTRDGAHTPRRNFLKDPKAKAFLSAFKSMMFDSDDSGDEGDDKESNQDDNDESKSVHEDDDDDLLGFLSMIGSLKD